MRKIRRGVFETNSSSTHSLTMCANEDYEKWKNGEVLLDNEGYADEQFITKEKVIQILKEDKYNSGVDFNNEEKVKRLMRENEFYTYDDYFEDYYLESFCSRHTTKSGEIVVAFGKYGYDG